MSDIMDIEQVDSIGIKEAFSININKIDNMDLFLAQLLCDFKFAVMAERSREWEGKSNAVSTVNDPEVDVPLDLTVARPSVERCSKPVRHEGNLKCKFPGCFKSFASSKYLNQHKISHKPAKFRCSLCARKYRRKSALVKHRKDKHRCKPYQCDYDNCQEEFMSSVLLEEHRSDKHSKCCFCGEAFLNLAGLKLHLRKCRVLEEEMAESDAKRSKEVEQNEQLSPASLADQQRGEWNMSSASESSPSSGTSGYSSSPDLSVNWNSYKLN